MMKPGEAVPCVYTHVHTYVHRQGKRVEPEQAQHRLRGVRCRGRGAPGLGSGTRGPHSEPCETQLITSTQGHTKSQQQCDD